MLTGCINGVKSEENRYIRLKTSQLTAYLHPFGPPFTWVCSIKALLLQANLNAFAQKTGVKKDWKADNFTQRIDTHRITEPPHISRIYNKQGCCWQIRQRWRGVCQEKGQFTFRFEHGRFVPLLRCNLLISSLRHAVWFKHTAHQQPTGSGWSYVKVRK